ncbi:hypothetical protein QX204_09950 [Nocardia sp. PE-7]|uniref:hypothetical protein n=1 Tax=Nocardia sp. PE-7 TaxID=3058426 RepID=UPI00265A2716|nr:hypothetical protein [Nocardia sp. PE-7]WKG11750.1 hypothetical protein QX204_09950 [Nocardia sp. PE-7]
MAVLPTASQTDRADQEAFVFDADREGGLDVTAVLADACEHSIDTADLSDHIDQASSVPCVDDISCLAY